VPANSARVTTSVEVPPEEAFRIFTDEIDAWWRRGPRFRGGGTASVLAFQTVGGERHLVEIGDERFLIGRVLAWEPGARLVFEWRGRSFHPEEKTEVEIRFEPTESGTRVILEHRGWEGLRGDHPVRHGLTGPAFTAMIGLHWGDLVTAYRVHTTTSGH
jgi:uncharacterized protein YndB with AHSA1/START domain